VQVAVDCVLLGTSVQTEVEVKWRKTALLVSTVPKEVLLQLCARLEHIVLSDHLCALNVQLVHMALHLVLRLHLAVANVFVDITVRLAVLVKEKWIVLLVHIVRLAVPPRLCVLLEATVNR